ncbi:hypothetical protein HPB49_012277 [Dermacentor silvarum]|uniref:Uncharacterized protein n=1 Tax=Dermacentor silvarum TaxID=543639 RepID=A0ACB8DCX0_DERSI|nr:hypothetical protein HPB49_012277 [Dermacentor silvarum]
MLAQCSHTMLHQLQRKGSGLCLRLVDLHVPGAVRSGEPVQLRCEYDLENAELYSVKWYKNNVEFYRYLPSDVPPGQSYELLGTFVDHSRSDKNNVFLEKTDLNTEGMYGCEVSTEGPGFKTVKGERELRIYGCPPREGSRAAIILDKRCHSGALHREQLSRPAGERTRQRSAGKERSVGVVTGRRDPATRAHVSTGQRVHILGAVLITPAQYYASRSRARARAWTVIPLRSLPRPGGAPMVVPAPVTPTRADGARDIAGTRENDVSRWKHDPGYPAVWSRRDAPASGTCLPRVLSGSRISLREEYTQPAVGTRGSRLDTRVSREPHTPANRKLPIPPHAGGGTCRICSLETADEADNS